MEGSHKQFLIRIVYILVVPGTQFVTLAPHSVPQAYFIPNEKTARTTLTALSTLNVSKSSLSCTPRFSHRAEIFFTTTFQIDSDRSRVSFVTYFDIQT